MVKDRSVIGWELFMLVRFWESDSWLPWPLYLILRTLGAVLSLKMLGVVWSHRYNMGKSQNFPVHIPTFLQKSEGDPAVKVNTISTHILPALTHASRTLSPNWENIYFHALEQHFNRRWSPPYRTLVLALSQWHLRLTLDLYFSCLLMEVQPILYSLRMTA